MKILYLDCFSGISGDMFLGALLDLGVDEDEFLKEIKKIPLEFEIEIKNSFKNRIKGKDVYIRTHEHHPHRGLKEVVEIIEESAIKENVKEKAIKAFEKLAEVEASIHGVSKDEIHFHEVGAIDSIVDIVGAFVLVDMICPDKILFSPINVGSGTVKCAHGILPVPAPATLELLKGVPIYSKGDGELTTPTGALLASFLSSGYAELPQGILIKSAYGFGKKERETLNALRAVLIETKEKYEDEEERDEVYVIETNIDDMNPQFYDSVMEKIFKKGAVDVFLTPINMKKGRPAVKLSCLSPLDKKDEIINTIFNETTTIGVRFYKVGRVKLKRHFEKVKTSLGEITVKFAGNGKDISKKMPEYEEVKKIAEEKGIPVRLAYEKICYEINRN
ncbi:MAG: nickel pincer cofactor biosynthesis protein LarC [Thermovenabulum sp.]|uniref:nickel pincer cofactor biosynthesis protein LarC n=1 Tax=Thermovenabulum sp. TaxID=3100335 RepID=UPI003C7D47AC